METSAKKSIWEKLNLNIRDLIGLICGIIGLAICQIFADKELEWVMLIGVIFLIPFWVRFSSKIWEFIKNYGRYLYIALIYFLILGLFLNKFEQADSLFLSFTEEGWSASYRIFIAQFPLSILVVWFLPYYLMFSDTFYRQHLGRTEAKLMKKGDFIANIFLPFRAVLLMVQTRKTPIADLEASVKSYNDENSAKHRAFHNVRRLSGAVYIGLLINLLAEVTDKMGFDEIWVRYPILIVLIMIIGFYALVVIEIVADNQPSPKFITEKLIGWRLWWAPTFLLAAFIVISLSASLFRGDGINIYHIILVIGGSLCFLYGLKWSRKVGFSGETNKADVLEWQWLKVIRVVMVSSMIISLIGAIYYLVLSWSPTADELNPGRRGLRELLTSAYFLLWFFLCFSYLRRKSRYGWNLGKWGNELLRLLDEPGTGLLMAFNLGLLILFIASFWGSAINYEQHIANNGHGLNPINVFFLFVNGLMILIAYVDRGLTIWSRYLTFNPKDKSQSSGITGIFSSILIRHRNEGTLENPNNRVRILFNTFLLSLIILIAWRAKTGNDFHTIAHQPIAELKSLDDKLLTLEAYTQQFLDRKREQKTPIYLIASDGGGLKAAYWTMRILNELEAKGGNQFDFKEDVFLGAGASGGSVGLGLYTYMTADLISMQDAAARRDTIAKRITTIGSYNFVSSDLIGLFSRWPYKLWPPKHKNEPDLDRMDVLGRNIFMKAGDMDTSQYNQLNRESYAQLWTQPSVNYQLPLFITNTARLEDGSKGIMHPLAMDDAKEIFGGAMDLTYVGLDQDCNLTEGTQALSFPEALMTTNRFPIFSPMAKIEGRGHFVDAGAVDNSGKSTVLQVLQYMKQKANAGNAVFCRFFQDHKIILLSIRCDKQRYYYEQFKEFAPQLTHTDQRYYVSTYLGGAVNTGLTGSPRQYEGMLDQEAHRQAFGIDTDVINLSIPFYVPSLEEVFSVLGSRVAPSDDTYAKMEAKRIKKNDELFRNLMGKSPAHAGNTRSHFLEPPLARTLSQSTMTYMDESAIHLSQQFFSPIKSSPTQKDSLITSAPLAQ